jgi:deazaflavin-dependent oxidoreductase (nitroreductase family)
MILDDGRLDSGTANCPSSDPTMSCNAGGHVDENIRIALHHSQMIDLTTTGRRTGQPRKIEIFLHDEDGLLFISGVPRADRTRDWIHNITADPHVVVHLKQSLTADIPATARVVTDPAERRSLMEAAARHWGRTDVDEMVQHSPLIVLAVPEPDGQTQVR